MRCAGTDPQSPHLNDVRIFHGHAGVFGFALPLGSRGANLPTKYISVTHICLHIAASRLLSYAMQILPQEENIAAPL